MIQSCSFQGEDHRRENKLYGFSGGAGWFHHHQQDKATINRIMLKFRPIAPKPAIHGSSSGINNPFLSKRRTKRKYVRTNKTNKAPAKPMPEEKKTGHSFGLGLGLALGPDRVETVESLVVVKGVTVAGAGGGGMLGGTDAEKMRSLEGDTCPGFVTDGLQKVQWVNPSYKMMVVGGGVPTAEMAVRLVLEEDIPVGFPAFACTARVAYTWLKEKYSKTMPCDVWRMDFGGFAWRLDAKAALCLGR